MAERSEIKARAAGAQHGPCTGSLHRDSERIPGAAGRRSTPGNRMTLARDAVTMVPTVEPGSRGIIAFAH